jgi:hypothetical protein
MRQPMKFSLAVLWSFLAYGDLMNQDPAIINAEATNYYDRWERCFKKADASVTHTKTVL